MNIISSQTHLSCILDEGEHVSALGMKMLSQMKDSRVISAAQVVYNGRDKLIYRTEDLETVASISSYITAVNKLVIVIGLAKLIKQLDESAFLDKEFLEVEPEEIYINPANGMPGFIVAPITGSTTGMLRRHWMERLYRSLSFLLFAGDGAVPDDLKELVTMLERQSLEENNSGELNISDLIAICNYVVENFADRTIENADDITQTSRGGREARLSYSGRYGNFTLFAMKNDFVIGKSPDCDGKIPFNNAISRRHGCLNIEPSGVFYTDLGSSNHSYLNGRMLNPEQKVAIASGDTLRLADMDFVVEIS